jgi:hypothetical protein
VTGAGAGAGVFDVLQPIATMAAVALVNTSVERIRMNGLCD